MGKAHVVENDPQGLGIIPVRIEMAINVLNADHALFGNESEDLELQRDFCLFPHSQDF